MIGEPSLTSSSTTSISPSSFFISSMYPHSHPHRARCHHFVGVLANELLGPVAGCVMPTHPVTIPAIPVITICQTQNMVTIPAKPVSTICQTHDMQTILNIDKCLKKVRLQLQYQLLCSIYTSLCIKLQANQITTISFLNSM